MSAKWMGYFFDETDLEGSELLLALAIADHADSEGVCRPGIELLAKKVRLKIRQTQILLHKLEAKNVVKIVRQNGRGRLAKFQLLKVHSSAPIEEPKKVYRDAPIEKEKGAFSRQKKVHSGNIPFKKDEPFKEPVVVGAKNALDIYREFFPNFRLNDFQEGLLKIHSIKESEWRACVKYWASKGHRANNLPDLFDCYQTEGYKPKRPPPAEKLPTVAEKMKEQETFLKNFKGQPPPGVKNGNTKT